MLCTVNLYIPLIHPYIGIIIIVFVDEAQDSFSRYFDWVSFCAFAACVSITIV